MRARVDEMPVLEVRAVFQNGDDQLSRFWTMGDAIEPPDMQEWMVDPRKTWAHPQEPVVLSFLVAPGREGEAREWVEGL